MIGPLYVTGSQVVTRSQYKDNERVFVQQWVSFLDCIVYLTNFITAWKEKRQKKTLWLTYFIYRSRQISVSSPRHPSRPAPSCCDSRLNTKYQLNSLWSVGDDSSSLVSLCGSQSLHVNQLWLFGSSYEGLGTRGGLQKLTEHLSATVLSFCVVLFCNVFGGAWVS